MLAPLRRFANARLANSPTQPNRIVGQHGYTPGDFGWIELYTTNAKDSLDFYTALTGWELKPGPMPEYHVVGRGDEMLGGITNLQEGESVPRWMPYLTVEDLNATVAKAESLGATIVMPPMAIPGSEEAGVGGHIAIIKDPQGVMTGLAQYTKKD